MATSDHAGVHVVGEGSRGNVRAGVGMTQCGGVGLQLRSFVVVVGGGESIRAGVTSGTFGIGLALLAMGFWRAEHLALGSRRCLWGFGEQGGVVHA